MQYSSIPQHNGNLRQHQIDAKRQIFEAWDDYDSVMLQMPTGTGKTYLFVSLINDLLHHYKELHKELHILIIAHRTELIDQISASLSRYGIRHGIVQGNREQQLWHRVQVASIQSILSARNQINTIRQQFDYIIVDEAHHSLANTYKQLFETFPDAKKLGVTATPYRLNHETFLPLYQKLITTPQISWFIANHLLADFDYVSIRPNSMIQHMVDNTEVAQTGDFANADLDITFNQRPIRAKLFDAYQKYAWGRKGIIYAINKSHAYNIASLYSSRGVKAVAIDCDTPKEERQQMIEAFRQGDIKVLVNVEIFTEGFDCADVSFIQLARPTCSLALYLQQVGRGLRIVDGKEKTIIIDNVGLYNYFGLPDADRDWQLYFKGRDVDEISYGSGDGNSLSRERNNEDSFVEDNEEMLVIKGGNGINSKSQKKSPQEKTVKQPVVEFSLCDYYLVHGNRVRFRVYPFIKNRGKLTQDVGNCLFEYDAAKTPLSFTVDTENNLHQLACNPKAQAIVSFAAILCKRPLRSILDLNHDSDLPHESISLFDLFQHIEALYQKHN